MKETERDKLLFSVPQAAKALDVSESQVWQWLKDGILQGVKIGKLRKITRRELDRYVASLETEGTGQ